MRTGRATVGGMPGTQSELHDDGNPDTNLAEIIVRIAREEHASIVCLERADTVH